MTFLIDTKKKIFFPQNSEYIYYFEKLSTDYL